MHSTHMMTSKYKKKLRKSREKEASAGELCKWATFSVMPLNLARILKSGT